MVRSNWMGYDKDANGLLFYYWRTFTRGSDSVFFWMCQGVGNFHGFLAPDLSPFTATRELLADTQITRDGLGDLLLQYPRSDDGIALLYSMPSESASGLENGPTFGTSQAPMNAVNHANEHAAWYQAIWDQGLQFTYVTDRMLKTTPLDAKRYKILILPRTDALGPEAAKAIRAYVEAGGTVIADIRPGLYTDHCKPRAAGCLDDLFGIKRGEDKPAKIADLHIDGKFGALPLALSWSIAEARAQGGALLGPRVDPAGTVTTGTACGKADGVPICIIHKVGKGQAVLLNFTLATSFTQRYLQLHLPENKARTPEPFSRFLGNLFATAGVTPPLTRARLKPGSCGKTLCSAQTSGRTGPVASLPSDRDETPGDG
jgi:hypothetical protein